MDALCFHVFVGRGLGPYGCTAHEDKTAILWYEAPRSVPGGIVILVWEELHSLSELILGGVVIENLSFVTP